MTDDSVDDALERFLEAAESTLDDYEQGYADADATLTVLLTVLRTHIDELAAVVDEGDGD